jgi:hypothetical protein
MGNKKDELPGEMRNSSIERRTYERNLYVSERPTSREMSFDSG